MRKILIIIFCLHSLVLFSSGGGCFFPDTLLSNAEGPDCIVNNTVNIITGNYIESAIDLVVRSPHALSFNRYFNGHDTRMKPGPFFAALWRTNHCITLEYGDHHSEGETFGIMADPCGASLILSGQIGKTLTLQDKYNKGITNCGTGEISGQVDLHNYQIHWEQDHHVLRTGSGIERHYVAGSKPMNHLLCALDRREYLHYEQRPDGTRLTNTYLQPWQRVDRVSLSAGNKTFGWLRFHYGIGRKAWPEFFRIESSDGRYFDIYCDNYNYGIKGLGGYTCARIEGNCIVPIKYHYVAVPGYHSPMIGLRELPEGRGIATSYYDKHNENPIGARVSEQKAPVGEDGTFITTHRYQYHISRTTDGIINDEGRTDVFDAYNNKTTYLYDPQTLLLSEVQQFRADGTLYRKEIIQWTKHGRLSSKTIVDASGTTIYIKDYQYDTRGNIIQECSRGNLIGLHEIKLPPEIAEENSNEDSRYPPRPRPQASKSYEKKFAEKPQKYLKNYTYSNDGLNLLLNETDTDGNTTFYRYHPNTNLLTAKLICEGTSIRKRQFFQYEDSIPVREIVDDGTTTTPNDLTNVTQRLITTTSLRQENPALGMPETITETYLDVKTKKEVLLKKTVNTYSDQNLVIRQDIYDSTNTLRYSLHTEYNDRGLITKQTDPLGNITSYDYDANNNQIFSQGPSSNYYTTYTYDYSNRLVATKKHYNDGTTFTTRQRYDYKNNTIAEIDIYGNETTYQYDEFSRCIAITRPNGATIHQQYDVLNHVTTTIDPLQHTSTTIYNIRGQPLSSQHPDGTQDQFQYNTNGTLRAQLTREGKLYRYQYDFLRRTTSTAWIKTPSKAQHKTKKYNTFHLISETDFIGNTTSYTYDGAGRLTSSTLRDTSKKTLAKTTYEYDTLGRQNIVKEWDSDTTYTTTILEHDLLGRIIEKRIEDHKGNLYNKISYSYDSEGRVTKTASYHTDKPSTTTTSYNNFGRPAKIVDALGNTTTFQYNIHQHRLHKIEINPIGTTTTTIFDTQQQPVSITTKSINGILLAQQELFYDLTGNKIKEINHAITNGKDSHTITTTWTYNPTNKITSCTEATNTNIARTTSYHYDKFGRLTEIIKPNNQKLLYKYKNGLLHEFSDFPQTFHYTYQHDPNGNIITVTSPKSKLTRKYDGAQRLTHETTDTNLSTSRQYDYLGRCIRIQLPDDTAIKYTYLGPNLHTVQRLNTSNKTIYTHSYDKYNLAQQPTSTTMICGLGTIQHSYDTLGREISTTSPYWKEYITQYDPLSNITSSTITDPIATTTLTYTYTPLSQLASEQGIANHTYTTNSLSDIIAQDGTQCLVNDLHQLLKDKNNSYQYDSQGNLKSKNNIQYTHDSLGRLTDTTLSHMTYDAFNRRTSKQTLDTRRQPISTIRYIYDGQNEIGAVDENGAIIELRLLGHGKGAEIGAAIALELHGKVYAPIHNHQCSVCCIVDTTTKKAAETYRYSAFGETTTKSSINPWRFSSKRTDDDTGLIYFGRRHYDPIMKRWTSPDPAGFVDGPNLYCYLRNNPINQFDPYGLFSFRQITQAFTETLANITQFLFSLPGSIIEFIGKFLMPHPIMRVTTTNIGMALQGKDPAFQLEKASLQHFSLSANNSTTTSIANIQSTDFSPYAYTDSEGNRVVAFTTMGNGTNNSPHDADKMAQRISTIEGRDVFYVYNPRRGFFIDTLMCGLQRGLGIKDGTTKQLQQTWRTLIETATDQGYKVIIHHIAHSEGGIQSAQALQLLPSAYRQNIVIDTFGSGKITPKSAALSVNNIVSTKDLVPWSDPIGHLRNSNITYIQGSKGAFPGTDHSFFSDSYQKALIDQTRDFNQTYLGIQP